MWLTIKFRFKTGAMLKLSEQVFVTPKKFRSIWKTYKKVGDNQLMHQLNKLYSKSQLKKLNLRKDQRQKAYMEMQEQPFSG